MEDIVLSATVRTAKPKAVRRAGFVPVILNEPHKESIAIQLEASALNKVISHHGSKARLYIKLGRKKLFGYIKELQYNPLDRQVIHAAIQLVAKDSTIKLQMPISFIGLEALEKRHLQLHINKSDAELFGKTVKLPDSIVIDVSQLEVGGTVGVADLELPKGIKVMDPEDEFFAIVKEHRASLVVEDTEPTEPEVIQGSADVVDADSETST